MKINDIGNEIREVKEEYIDGLEGHERYNFSLRIMGRLWKHLAKKWLGPSRLDKITPAAVWQIEGEGVLSIKE